MFSWGPEKMLDNPSKAPWNVEGLLVLWACSRHCAIRPRSLYVLCGAFRLRGPNLPRGPVLRQSFWDDWTKIGKICLWQTGGEKTTSQKWSQSPLMGRRIWVGKMREWPLRSWSWPIKPGDKSLKKTQTSEDFHGGMIWRFLCGQVPLFEASAPQKAKRMCKFF